MTNKRFILSLAAVLAFLLMAPDAGYSIPAFARKYGFNCNMCHTGFVKLNDFGMRFRNNGYQLPGQQGREKNVFEIAPPLSLRTVTGLMVTHEKKSTASGFALNGLDLLAAGLLHKNIGFLLIYKPRIDDPSADFTGPDDGNNPSQLGTLESANIVFSNIVEDALNLRVGRFEPAYHAFSSKRSLYLVEPYEVYSFTTPNNDFVFEDNQLGVEASGHFREGFIYGAGVVNGNGAGPDNNNAKDFYGNVFQTFGRGDGQSAGQRIGAFGYVGWQPMSTGAAYVSEAGDADGKDNKAFYRVGGDLSLNWRTFNLKGLLLYGADDKALNSFDSTESYDYIGGFARLDWAGLMNNRVIASLMFNWVAPPEYDQSRKIHAYSALLRYYLGDWTAVNIALHGEYTYKRIGETGPQELHNFAAFVDFDF